MLAASHVASRAQNSPMVRLRRRSCQTKSIWVLVYLHRSVGSHTRPYVAMIMRVWTTGDAALRNIAPPELCATESDRYTGGPHKKHVQLSSTASRQDEK
jgi:hypothetical protein